MLSTVAVSKKKKMSYVKWVERDRRRCRVDKCVFFRISKIQLGQPNSPMPKELNSIKRTVFQKVENKRNNFLALCLMAAELSSEA